MARRDHQRHIPHGTRRRLYPPDRKNERKDGPPGSPEFLRRLRTRKTGDGIRGGRWSLLRSRKSAVISPTEWSANTAQQLLTRYGIVTRETAIAENIPGGYNTIYPALRTMEESGLIRRGMFVAGLGAAQFAMPSAVDMLRSLRHDPVEPESMVLAASDTANPYGSLLPWTRVADEDTESRSSCDGARERSFGRTGERPDWQPSSAERIPRSKCSLPDARNPSALRSPASWPTSSRN